MKIKFFIILIILNMYIFSETGDDPAFYPVSPEVIAQGGSFVSVANGYNSIFTNPAGYSNKNESFTLASASLNTYFIPNDKRLQGYSELFSTPSDGVERLGYDIANGIGAGAALGFAYVGKGLGLGFVNYSETYVTEDEDGEEDFAAHYTSAFIFGYAWKFGLKDLNLSFGLDVRPMIRVYAPGITLDQLSAFYDEPENETLAFDAYKGQTLAFDVGFLLNWGDFNIGLSVRDLFAEFNYRKVSSKEIYEANGIPSGGDLLPEDEIHEIPVNVSAGIAYIPDFGKLGKIFRPILHFEFRQVYYKEKNQAFIDKLHAGTELCFFERLKLRAGYDRGAYTFGAGLKVLFFDMNVAYFQAEPESSLEMNENAGISMEIALRF